MYDVIICGCGSAGFCAAIAAARMNMKTAIIEKYNTPGGILTVLGNNSIDQFNNPFIDKNKMVIKGIGWEYVLRLNKDGFAKIPDMDAEYKNHFQYGVKVNPVAAAKIMDDMLIESGVSIFYGQSVVDVETENDKISSVIISTKSGLRKLSAKVFVDCTGDGDLAAFAGADFLAGDGLGAFQPGTLRYYPATSAQDKILNYGDNTNHIKINVTDSDSVTFSEIESRRMIYEEMKNGSRIMATAPAVAPREGRRIAGLVEMNSRDYRSGKVFEDSVCYSYWFIDIHRDNEPTIIEYIKHNKTPTIRLSAMISKNFRNLMMAGRCISTDRPTNSAIRVKASCMAMGEAAGVAASVAVLNDTDVSKAPLDKIKETLAKTGAIVPEYTPTLSYKDVIKY